MGERPQRNHRNPARHNDFINWQVLEELNENYQLEHEALSNANEEKKKRILMSKIQFLKHLD